MNLIMLQRLDPVSYEDMGGLFIVVEHISALIPRIRQTHKDTHFYTEILLTNGVSYLVPFGAQEIYEMTIPRTEPR